MDLGTSLVARVGARSFALPIAHVVETMRPMPFATMRVVDGALRGTAIVRGVAIPIVDVGATSPTRLVVLRAGESRVGLLVDAVIGVRAVVALDDASPLATDVPGLAPALIVALASARQIEDAA